MCHKQWKLQRFQALHPPLIEVVLTYCIYSSQSVEEKKKKEEVLKVKMATWANSEALWLSVVYERAMKRPRCCGDEMSFWWTWRRERVVCWQHSEAILNSRIWGRPAVWEILNRLTLFLALVLTSLLHLQSGGWTWKVRACQLEKAEEGGGRAGECIRQPGVF